MTLSSFLQKMLFINQFSINNGKFELLGQRYIVLDSSDILALQDIDETKMYNTAKEGSRNHLANIVTHAKVYKNIKDESLKNVVELSKRIGKSEEGALRTLKAIFEIYGLGSMEIIDLDNSNKNVLLKINDSTLALTQLKKSKSKNSVCTLTSGILAGIFSYLFNKDVDCIENKCLATGNDSCYFDIG